MRLMKVPYTALCICQLDFWLCRRSKTWEDACGNWDAGREERYGAVVRRFLKVGLKSLHSREGPQCHLLWWHRNGIVLSVIASDVACTDCETGAVGMEETVAAGRW